jgi:DNA-binding CsgD family transcriptional regulator
MANQQNHEFALAHRRQQVTELSLQGWSQTSIAAHLGISQSTVSEDMQHVRKAWQESNVEALAEIRARELAKVDLIERESWAAWGRSQKPAQSAVVTGDGAGKQTRKSMKNQTGDPRFLDQINKCIAQRRALLGLDVVPAAAPPEGSFDGNVTLEVRHAEVHTLINAYLERERDGQLEADPAVDEPGDVCAGDEPGTLEDGDAPPETRPGDHEHPGGS